MYCTEADLSDYLYQAYLDKIEELRPGSINRHIRQVSSEIDDALRALCAVPLASAPATIKRICAVMAAWRLVGEITSLMDTEAQSANEWLPLQTLNKQSVADLKAISEGKLNIGIEQLGNVPVSDGLVVSAPNAIFTEDKWSTY